MKEFLLNGRGEWSSLLGWISIVCWIFVFTPQIVENYRRGSGDGLSILFLYLWLVGDLLNLVGAIGQHLLTTMIVLGAYYTLADSVLVAQVHYYEYKARRQGTASERSPLLSDENGQVEARDYESLPKSDEPLGTLSKNSLLKGIVYNVGMVLVIIALGFLAYLANDYLYPSTVPSHHHHRHGHGHGLHRDDDNLELVWWSQLLGYGSAILYLGSRIPQMAKNAKNKSCEGLSLTMFTLSVLGNLTYVTSIFLKSVSANYILLNLSWLAGSGGTILLDVGLFYQFYIYRGNIKGSGVHGEVQVEDPARQHV